MNRVQKWRLNNRKPCPFCGELIFKESSKCKKCFYLSRVTRKTVKRNYSSARIRALARKAYLDSNQPQSCFKCGYDKHFEVCHKKAINSFSDNTEVSIINNINNLVALCPNCHWEYDNGILPL